MIIWPSLYSPLQMVRVAWLFWFSKIIELIDTVSSVSLSTALMCSFGRHCLHLINILFSVSCSSCWGKNTARSPSCTSSTTPSCPGPGGGELPMPLVSKSGFIEEFENDLWRNNSSWVMSLLHPATRSCILIWANSNTVLLVSAFVSLKSPWRKLNVDCL